MAVRVGAVYVRAARPVRDAQLLSSSLQHRLLRHALVFLFREWDPRLPMTRL